MGRKESEGGIQRSFGPTLEGQLEYNPLYPQVEPAGLCQIISEYKLFQSICRRKDNRILFLRVSSDQWPEVFIVNPRTWEMEEQIHNLLYPQLKISPVGLVVFLEDSTENTRKKATRLMRSLWQQITRQTAVLFVSQPGEEKPSAKRIEKTKKWFREKENLGGLVNIQVGYHQEEDGWIIWRGRKQTKPKERKPSNLFLNENLVKYIRYLGRQVDYMYLGAGWEVINNDEITQRLQESRYPKRDLEFLKSGLGVELEYLGCGICRLRRPLKEDVEWINQCPDPECGGKETGEAWWQLPKEEAEKILDISQLRCQVDLYLGGNPGREAGEGYFTVGDGKTHYYWVRWIKNRRGKVVRMGIEAKPPTEL